MAVRTSGALSSFSTAEQFDLMQTFTESSSCRGCTWMFVRVFLAASRLQLRSPGRIRTAHEPSWSRSEGGWNEFQNEHPIESSRVDLVSPCVRARRTPSHCTWHNGRLLQTLTGKDVNSFTPWDTSSTRLAGLFVFKSRWTERFVSASKADTVPVSQGLRVRRNHERPRTRCNISVPSSSPQTRPYR